MTLPLVPGKATRAELRAAIDERDKLIASLDAACRQRDQTIAELDRQNRKFSADRMLVSTAQERLVRDLRDWLANRHASPVALIPLDQVTLRPAPSLGIGGAVPAPPSRGLMCLAAGALAWAALTAALGASFKSIRHPETSQ